MSGVRSGASSVSQRGRDPKLIERDIEIHVINPKPTKNFLFENAHKIAVTTPEPAAVPAPEPEPAPES